MLGRVTADRTIPELKRFVENGGTVITIGASSTNLARHFEAADRRSSRRERQAAAGGEVLRAGIGADGEGRCHASDRARHERADRHLLRHQPGVPARAGRGRSQGVKSVAWFDTAAPLKSGWAWGQQYLQNGVAVIDAPIGKGRVLLFGPEIMKRAQPHGTFKFLFNGLYYSVAGPMLLVADQRLDVPRDLFVRREPDARLALHVLHQPLEQRDARAMADEMRMHREEIETAFFVGDVELRLEHLLHLADRWH